MVIQGHVLSHDGADLRIHVALSKEKRKKRRRRRIHDNQYILGKVYRVDQWSGVQRIKHISSRGNNIWNGY